MLGLTTIHAGIWTVHTIWLWDGYDRLRQGAAGVWTDGGVATSGWLRPSLAVRKPALTLMLGATEVSWGAERAILTLAPSAVAIGSAAPQQVSWSHGVLASTDSLVVSTVAPRWSGTNLMFTAAPSMRVAQWEASWDGAMLTAVALDVAWSGLTADVSGRAVLTGTAPTWRLQDLAARWGPLALSGSATLEWDAMARPVLAGMLAIAGHKVGLDGLASAGVVTPSAAQAMCGVLDTLAAASPSGPVMVPVALRNGVLAVAGFPLLRVEALD